jgi:hypothetical protein
VGLYVLAFLYFMKRSLGASSGFQAVTEALEGKGDPEKLDFHGLSSKVELPVNPKEKAPRWRIWWLGGLFLGGLLSYAMGGEGSGSPELPGFSQ